MLARKELDQVSLNLLTAADNLDKKGWVRNYRRHPKGMCLLGAIESALGQRSNASSMTPEVVRLAKAIAFEAPSPAWTVAEWNNIICEDKDEAVAKLREAAYM